jgi:hypothetical protein
MQSGKTQREDSECLCPVSNIFMVLVSGRLRTGEISGAFGGNKECYKTELEKGRNHRTWRPGS